MSVSKISAQYIILSVVLCYFHHFQFLKRMAKFIISLHFSVDLAMFCLKFLGFFLLSIDFQTTKDSVYSTMYCLVFMHTSS